MKITRIIKDKALPSFCTSNIDVLNSILFFCHIKKLPCLIECTSNQVNQNGGYTNKNPKIFINEILNISKKINFDKNKLFLGGDHLGPLPWKNKNKDLAIKKSIVLIENFLKEEFCKIHIDTSIKCKDDKYINNEIIFDRTSKILSHPKIKKKIKNKFIIIGTEVPLSGSGDTEKVVVTKQKQIEDEVRKFRDILKSLKIKNKLFGLVVEPGMKYNHSSILKPNLSSFSKKKKLSKKNNFVYEAHSTDYQSQLILKKLVKNNFKFLKVGPELTYNYSRSLFLMHNIEKKIYKKNDSNIKNILIASMKKKNKYWKNYYEKKNPKLLIHSKLDRMRYYFNIKSVESSVKILKKNINQLNIKKIKSLLSSDMKKEFLFYNKKNLSNYDIIKLIFISKSLKKYFKACGFKFM